MHIHVYAEFGLFNCVLMVPDPHCYHTQCEKRVKIRRINSFNNLFRMEWFNHGGTLTSIKSSAKTAKHFIHTYKRTFIFNFFLNEQLQK